MLKMIGMLVVALLVVRVILIVIRCVFCFIDLSISHKKFFPKAESEYREAFRMECSGDMLEDPEVKKLDKVIKRIDRENMKLKKHREKMEKILANLT